MLHNGVVSSENAGLDLVKHAYRRMKHFAALPQNIRLAERGTLPEDLLKAVDELVPELPECYLWPSCRSSL